MWMLMSIVNLYKKDIVLVFSKFILPQIFVWKAFCRSCFGDVQFIAKHCYIFDTAILLDFENAIYKAKMMGSRY